MMRKVETEEAGGLADVVSVHQETLCLVNDVIVDVADGRATRCLVDDVAEITGRIGQFRGAIGDGGQTV